MKVGDYVRTDIGIIYKIKEVNKPIYNIGNCGIKEYGMFYEDICYSTHNYNEKIEIYGEDFNYKSSPNIIDLIEVGDIVKILNGMGEEELILIKNLNIEKPILESHKIISIITKEQFESMEYKVGKR